MLMKGMRERGESMIFLCYPRGSGAPPHSFREPGGVIECVCVCVCVCVRVCVCGVFVDD